jgi:hypothetical protein
MKKITIPLILCLLATTACWPFSSDEQGNMTVKRLSGAGRVQILRDNDEISVTDPEPLELGDIVSTTGHAIARVKLVGNDLVNIAADTEVRIASTKAVEGPLHTGSIVADTEGPMRVEFAGVAATSDGGIFRIDKGVASVRAGTYDGSWKLETPGQPRVALSRLFEVQAAASDLRGREPYKLDNSDPWDRVYLKDVVALDEDLTPLAQGLKSQLGGSRPNLLYFHTLAEQDVGFMKRYLPRPTIDLLTAFVISDNSPGPMGPDFVRAMQLADDGAEWPVVAGILDAHFDPLVAELTDIAASTGAVAGGTGSTAIFSLASAQAVTDAGPGDAVVPPPAGPGGSGGNNDDDDDPIAGGGGGGPQPSASPGGCSNDFPCTGNEAIDQVTHPDDPEPSPSSIVDPLDGVPK